MTNVDSETAVFTKTQKLRHILDDTLRKNSMHMVLCEPNFGKRLLQPQFITIAPPLYEGPDDEVSVIIYFENVQKLP